MKKKLLTLLFLVSAVVFALPAKDNNKISVRYLLTFYQYHNQKEPVTEEMVLDIDNEKSHFYSYFDHKRNLIKDSILAIGGSAIEASSVAIEKGLPRPKLKFHVWKNLPSRHNLLFTDDFIVNYRYSEPIEKINWTLIDRDSIICDHNCKCAESTFHGRKWIVWFTMEIPVSEGPWKLNGLPGLIMCAEDTENEFSFIAIGVSNGNESDIVVPSKKYVECSKSDYYEQMLLKWRNPEEYVLRVMGTVSYPVDKFGNKLKVDERKAIFLEKDREEK